MKTANPRRHRGFTLVEMLVVIAIIGILAAILIPTLYRVVIRARQNVIAQELNQLHLAIESYKQKFGDYPPDFTNLTVATQLTDPTHLVVRHIRKAFPRHTENLTNVFKDASGNFNQPDPAEALVLWLSQVREDPRLPLTSTGQRLILFPFDEKRLIDPAPNETAADGLFSYFPPSGKDMPYVYFDSRIYTNDNPISGGSPPLVASLCVYKDSAGSKLLYPYANKQSASTFKDNMANKTTYQLISAGLDGEYGDVSSVTAGTASTYKVFPFGTNYQIGDMDNIANFSDGKIFEDHME